MDRVDEVLSIYDSIGRQVRVGGLSVTEAALQAAHLAEREGAADSLVAASLLHDTGHLLVAHGDLATPTFDRHEDVGCRWLAEAFPRSVTEPIRLHVRAKRYLCTCSSHYKTRLSAEALRSLDRQGGTLGPDELLRFGQSDYFIESLQLRRWIDIARVPDLRRVPELEHYRPRLVALCGERTVAA